MLLATSLLGIMAITSTIPGLAATSTGKQVEPLSSIRVTGLYPNFTPAGEDYAVSNCANKTISLGVSATKGATVTIDGRAVKSGKATINTKADQIITVRAKLGKITRNWFLRCLPDDFPKLRVEKHGSTPSKGYYAFSTGERVDMSKWQLRSQYYVILDERGAPIWYMRGKGVPGILDRAANGNILTTASPNGISPSFAARGPSAVVETTLDGQLVTKHTRGAQDPIDGHSLQVLPNGNLLVLTVPIIRGVDLSDDFAQLQPLDVGGGGVDKCDVTNVRSADVAYPAIREITPDGELVWSWNSWEHLDDGESIIPALTNISYTGGVECVVDLFHGVIASQSPDGKTIIFTARFASATWGIDKASGSVRWKIGGIPSPVSLSIENDPYGKYGPRGQHGGIIDDKGRLLVFDNRRANDEISRGLLYQIDENERTASYVRGFEPPIKPCQQGPEGKLCNALSMGGARHTPAGGTLVSWGYKPGNPNLATEFDAKGFPMFTIMNLSGYHNTYEVLRLDRSAWPIAKLRKAASSLTVILPGWDSGLPDDASPEDTAVSTIK
jgi:hypothetical protein